ncbi:DNA polymerase III subunit epsilon [Luminiphilus sp.]|nr:DNA polymerase III subunit epsilon [Luminiphilus sp.]
MDKRQIVLDTETTGLEVNQGHRIIEIGCVELLNRRVTGRHYHQYLHPERDIDAGAMEVHGITLEFLLGKPTFEQVADEFIEFIRGAELVIHNAPFDIGFIDAELSRFSAGSEVVKDICEVIDTLQMARHKHPGQRNNLDALCQRYEIDNTSRSLHGALLDAEILAEVYLAMTGGQTSLGLGSDGAGSPESGTMQTSSIRPLPADRPKLAVLRATPEEVERHEQKLRELDQTSGEALWRRSQ